MIFVVWICSFSGDIDTDVFAVLVLATFVWLHEFICVRNLVRNLSS